MLALTLISYSAVYELYEWPSITLPPNKLCDNWEDLYVKIRGDEKTYTYVVLIYKM